MHPDAFKQISTDNQVKRNVVIYYMIISVSFSDSRSKRSVCPNIVTIELVLDI